MFYVLHVLNALFFAPFSHLAPTFTRLFINYSVRPAKGNPAQCYRLRNSPCGGAAALSRGRANQLAVRRASCAQAVITSAAFPSASEGWRASTLSRPRPSNCLQVSVCTVCAALSALLWVNCGVLCVTCVECSLFRTVFAPCSDFYQTFY